MPDLCEYFREGFQGLVALEDSGISTCDDKSSWMGLWTRSSLNPIAPLPHQTLALPAWDGVDCRKSLAKCVD